MRRYASEFLGPFTLVLFGVRGMRQEEPERETLEGCSEEQNIERIVYT